MPEELVVVFSYETVDSEQAWLAIVNLLRKEGLLATNQKISIYGKKKTLEQVRQGLELDKRGTFFIEFNKFNISLARIFKHNLDILSIVCDQSLNYSEYMKDLPKQGVFIQAFVVDEEYNYWQNAFDPIQFQARSRPFQHLPMKSNGLPPPLEKTIIDTSKNPGRRVLMNGYIEAVAAQMWFSKEILAETGAKTDELHDDSKLNVTKESDILHFFAGEPFKDSTSEEIQNSIRQMLFPRSNVVS